MARARYRGLEPLHKQLYLTASVQNLIRLVSFMRGKNAAVQSQIHEKVSCCYPPFGILSWFNPFKNSLNNLLHKFLPDFMAKQKYYYIILCIITITLSLRLLKIVMKFSDKIISRNQNCKRNRFFNRKVIKIHIK